MKPATGEVPDDPYQVGEVTPTTDYGNFTKSLSVYGLTLVAKDDVSDDFLRAVRQTVVEMFSKEVASPADQAAFLEKLHAHRAVIRYSPEGEQGIDEEAIESMDEGNSVCDIIMQGSSLQVMEVGRTLLHFITDIGLHGVYPSDWGLREGTTLVQLSEEAQSAGLYDVSGYTDIPNPQRQGVILQEFRVLDHDELLEPPGALWTK